MGGRGRDSARGRAGRVARDDDAPSLNLPFAELGKRLRTARAAAPPPPPAPKPAPRREEPDLFENAMAGVVPLARGRGARIDGPAPAPLGRRPVSEEAEALAELSDLVGGSGSFDISDTREYVEGAIVGLDPRLVRRLRRGDFSYQAHIDLHGMTAAAAHV